MYSDNNFNLLNKRVDVEHFASICIPHLIFYSISAAIKQDFLKNELSVTIGCDNIVNSQYWVSETFNNNFYSRTDYLIVVFRFKIGLTYSINDYKPSKEQVN